LADIQEENMRRIVLGFLIVAGISCHRNNPANQSLEPTQKAILSAFRFGVAVGQAEESGMLPPEIDLLCGEPTDIPRCFTEINDTLSQAINNGNPY
jgi:hypothetical protein